VSDQRSITVRRSRQGCRQTALPACRYIPVLPTPHRLIAASVADIRCAEADAFCHGYEVQRRRPRGGDWPVCPRFGCQPARFSWLGDSGSPGRTDSCARRRWRVGIGALVTPTRAGGWAVGHRPSGVSPVRNTSFSGWPPSVGRDQRGACAV